MNLHNSNRTRFVLLLITAVCWTSVVLAARPGWQRQEVNWPMTGGASVEAVNYPEGKAPPLLFKQTGNLTKHPTKDTTQKESASEPTSLTTQPAPLIPAGRNRTLRNCKTMFETAVIWELIPKNPFKSVKAPKCILRDWHFVKPWEYHRLIKAAHTLRRRAMYALAYTAGLRLGEFLNLMWEDINFKTGKVKVRNRHANEKLPPFYIKDCEARTIRLPKHTLDILIDLKAYNEVTDQTPFVLLDDRQYKTAISKWQKFRQIGREWRNQDMQNNTLTIFKRHVKSAEIKPNGTLSLHTLRKSCIQNWANNITNPEVVRVLAGHGDLKTTMMYYAQADPEQEEKAAAAIDNLLSKTDVKLTYGDNRI